MFFAGRVGLPHLHSTCPTTITSSVKLSIAAHMELADEMGIVLTSGRRLDAVYTTDWLEDLDTNIFADRCWLCC